VCALHDVWCLTSRQVSSQVNNTCVILHQFGTRPIYAELCDISIAIRKQKELKMCLSILSSDVVYIQCCCAVEQCLPTSHSTQRINMASLYNFKASNLYSGSKSYNS